MSLSPGETLIAKDGTTYRIVRVLPPEFNYGPLRRTILVTVVIAPVNGGDSGDQEDPGVAVA
jgi:hypothetical protein